MPDPNTPPPTVVPAPPPPPPALPAAAVTPPPGAPPPAEKPKIDPWMKHMAESLGMAVTDDITLVAGATPPAEQPGEGEPVLELPRSRTLTEIGLESIAREKAKAEAAAAAGAPGAPAPPAAPAAPVVEVPPVVPPIALKPGRASVDELAARVTKDVLDQVKKLQTPPAPPETPPAGPTAEEQWEATLPEANREMLELIRWGETNGIEGLKGKAVEQSAYFRRLEDFAKGNPEDDALKEWIAKNKPALAESLLRKASEERILTRAEERAMERLRKENAPRLAEIEAKQRTAEVKPLVEAAVSEFNDRFERTEEKTRTGTPRIDGAVAKSIRTEGIDKASELWPIEAPIVHQYTGVARDFLDLRAGIAAHDPAKPSHQFLANFIFRQEQALLAQPEEKRIVNGQPFLPGAVYYTELAKDPTIAQRYGTFTDQNVLDMLEETAHRAVKKEYDRLEKAGFVRKPAIAPVVVPTEPAKPAITPAVPEAGAAAPRAGASKAPGAAAPGSNETNPNMEFLKKIYPDAERVLAA